MPNTLDVRQKGGMDASRHARPPHFPEMRPSLPRSSTLAGRGLVRPALPAGPRARSGVSPGEELPAYVKGTARQHLAAISDSQRQRECLPLTPAVVSAELACTAPDPLAQAHEDNTQHSTVSDADIAIANRRRKPDGGVVTRPPGRAQLDKTRSRHGVRKHLRPLRMAGRTLRYAATYAPAGATERVILTPSTVLTPVIVPAASGLEDAGHGARAVENNVNRGDAWMGYRTNTHSDDQVHVINRMTTGFPWYGAITRCLWRETLCMLAASAAAESLRQRRGAVSKPVNALAPEGAWPSGESRSEYGGSVGGLWLRSAARVNAPPAIGSAFAGTLTNIPALGGGKERPVAAGVSDAQGAMPRPCRPLWS